MFDTALVAGATNIAAAYMLVYRHNVCVGGNGAVRGRVGYAEHHQRRTHQNHRFLP